MPKSSTVIRIHLTPTELAAINAAAAAAGLPRHRWAKQILDAASKPAQNQSAPIPDNEFNRALASLSIRADVDTKQAYSAMAMRASAHSLSEWAAQVLAAAAVSTKQSTRRRRHTS